MYTHHAIAVVVLSCLCSVAIAADGETDGVRGSEIRAPDPKVVRSFIVDAVNSSEELKTFSRSYSVEESIPPYYDVYYPGTWPNFREIGSGGRRPFLKLGDWRLQFGAPYALAKEELSNSPAVLKSVSLVKMRYVGGDDSDEMECTECVLYVGGSANLDDWKNGRVQRLELSGWEILRYRLRNYGTFARGEGAACIAAGGDKAKNTGRMIDASITHEAFVGHVERVIPKNIGRQ